MKLTIFKKLSLTAVLLVLITASAVGGLFYTRTTNILVNNVLEDFEQQTRFAGNVLHTRLSTQYNDVLLLSETPPFQGILRARNKDKYDSQGKSSYEQWVRRLQIIFATILKNKPTYLKIRFIDETGQEIVVVGREGTTIKNFSGSQLKNRSQRIYVKETLKLPVRSVFISEINLRREHNKISQPQVEVFRNSTPIYNLKTNNIAGILNITAEIGNELRRIKKNIYRVGRNIYITNDDGGYLLHPDNTKTYGFDLGKQYRIQEDFPKLAKYFIPENTEMQTTLLPNKNNNNEVVNFIKIPIDVTNPKRFIAVIMTQKYSSIVAEESAVLDDLIIWTFFLALLAIGLAILFTIRITRPINQMIQAVEDLSHHHSTTVILPINSNDEIGVLARKFDSMFSEIKNSQLKLSEANKNLEQIVSVQTNSLKDTKAEQATIVEAIADAIITIDSNGLITSFNPAAVEIFGYNSNEVLDQNVNMLLPEDEREIHDGYTKNSNLHARRIINRARNLEGLRKNGTKFPLELNVTPIPGLERRGFVGILRDITQRENVKKELLLAIKYAESANRAKSEFLSSMSHELRTPMNAIMGFSQLLKIDTQYPLVESQLDSIDEIMKASSHLLELINEVLDLARIEAGHIDLSIEKVILGDVISESLDLIMPLIKNREIEIDLKHNGTTILFDVLQKLHYSVKADRVRLKQVLLNLLSNAVKYNKEKGKLTLNIDNTKEDFIRISISDTGKGLSVEQQSHLFKAFDRLGTEQSYIEGTGIGLVITKNIIEHMGGNIGFKSKIGVGSTFWITLQNDTIVKNTKNVSSGKKITQSEFIAHPEKQYNLLYIEDNPANLRLVTHIFSRIKNISIWSSPDALLGLELALERLPDLILLDINLPRMNGYDVLKQLRLNKKTRYTHIIAITANAMTNDINRGLASGFDDYITKPINVSTMLKSVELRLLDNKN